MPDQASTIGRHHMPAFGSYFEDLCRGKPVVVPDVRTDARTNAASLGQINIAALLNMPLMEQGRVVAMLYVNASASRTWTIEEVGFVRDVLERTRLVIQRRRAEHELRDLAASLERQVEERTRALRDSEDFTRLALTAVGGVGVWTYDVPSDRFVCDRAIAALYALDPA